MLADRQKINRRNRHKPMPRKRFSFGFVFSAIRIAFLAGAVFVLSAGFIFCHDMILQLSFLNIKKINISGISRLSKPYVLEKTGISQGINIMAFNLPKSLKLLQAEPWVESAGIVRELPDQVNINIKERKAFAQIDFGETYLVDTAGRVFKKLEDGDPENFPFITGIAYQDTLGTPGVGSERWNEVMDILSRGFVADSVLPLKLIRWISVDYEIGVNVTLEDNIQIKFGTGNFGQKYKRLDQIMHQGRNVFDYSMIETIDLQNPDRIIVGFKKEVPDDEEGKEV